MRRYLLWAAQIVPAVLMGMTLFFKFTGAPESVALFTTLGVEPWGRYLTGALELASVVLLLVPAPYLGKHAWGALLGAVIMLGALGAHVAKLGFDGANGQLAVMAAVALACCLYVLWERRAEVPFVGR